MEDPMGMTPKEQIAANANDFLALCCLRAQFLSKDIMTAEEFDNLAWPIES